MKADKAEKPNPEIGDSFVDVNGENSVQFWESDADYRSKKIKGGVQVISTTRAARGANQKPNYLSMRVYQTVVAVGSAKLDYLLWFHFAEIDSKITKAGQRVFEMWVNSVNVNRIDVFKSVGGSKAHDWHYVVKNLSSTLLTVELSPVVGEPILCGLDNYAIVPNDLAIVLDQEEKGTLQSWRNFRN